VKQQSLKGCMSRMTVLAILLPEKAILAQIVNGSDFPLKGNTAVGCPDLRQNNVSHPSAVVKINRAPVVQVGG